MWRRPWPVVLHLPSSSWFLLLLWPSLLIILLLDPPHILVEGYCEQVILSAKSSALSQTLVPKHPGPHVHIFGPSSGTSYHPPQQVYAGQIFIKPKGIQIFEFTCVSAVPVNWHYIGPGVSSVDVTFQRGRNTEATCFFMTMVFPASVNDITGQYICYQESSPDVASNFTIFAGNSGGGYLLLSSKNPIIRDSMEAQPILQLPCIVNDPHTNITLWDKVHNVQNNNESWREVPHEYYTFDPLTGIRLNTTENGPKGIYKCETPFANPAYTKDAVYVTYFPPPEILVRPDSGLLMLPAKQNRLKLGCYAMVPVAFTHPTDEDNDDEGASSGLRLEFPTEPPTANGSTNVTAVTASDTNYGYKYGAVVTLNFGQLRNTTWTISCAPIGTAEVMLHTWEIQFSHDDFTPGIVFDPSTSTATCFSTSPVNITWYYVLCELRTQCEFLAPCLHDSQQWQCPDSVPKIPKQIGSNDTSATVQLQDASGALSCIGVDVNQTIYVHRTASNGKLNLDQDQSDLLTINVAGNLEILLGSMVQVECIASMRFFINNLTFQLWAGDTMIKLLTQGMTIGDLPWEFVSNEENSYIPGMFLRRISFKMLDYAVDQIICLAPRYDGNTTVSQSARVKVKKKSGLHGSAGVNWTAIVLGVTAALFFVLVVIVMYFLRKTKAKAKAFNPGLMLSDMEFELLQRFREGAPQHLRKGGTDGDSSVNGLLDTDRDRAGDEYLNIVEDGHYYAQMIPYNTDAHEIALEKLKFDLDPKGNRIILGIGEYGIVYRGVYDNGTFGIPIASKELKPNAQYVYLKALLAEIKIMIYVGQHENIVEFLGACTKSKLEACIVLRLYPYGTLEKYLRDHRQTLAYQNVTSLRPITNAGSGYVNPTELCVNDLIKWSVQIASALEYLFVKKVIHGDLATRNVLLDETLTAKVSDFGLARQRYNDYDFPKLCDMPLPWRWMSIESLRYLDFTQQSDLWSFGVTIWEIFSLGEIPYIGQRLSSSFLNDLENGVRLEQPTNASEELYELMRDCWIANAKDRITIHAAKRRLEGIMENAAAPGAPSQAINYRQIEFLVTDTKMAEADDAAVTVSALRSSVQQIL